MMLNLAEERAEVTQVQVTLDAAVHALLIKQHLKPPFLYLRRTR